MIYENFVLFRHDVSPGVQDTGKGGHVLLDEPLCLVTALRAVLADWVPPSAPGDA